MNYYESDEAACYYIRNVKKTYFSSNSFWLTRKTQKTSETREVANEDSSEDSVEKNRTEYY